MPCTKDAPFLPEEAPPTPPLKSFEVTSAGSGPGQVVLTSLLNLHITLTKVPAPLAHSPSPTFCRHHALLTSTPLLQHVYHLLPFPPLPDLLWSPHSASPLLPSQVLPASRAHPPPSIPITSLYRVLACSEDNLVGTVFASRLCAGPRGGTQTVMSCLYGGCFYQLSHVHVRACAHTHMLT